MNEWVPHLPDFSLGLSHLMGTYQAFPLTYQAFSQLACHISWTLAEDMGLSGSETRAPAHPPAPVSHLHWFPLLPQTANPGAPHSPGRCCLLCRFVSRRRSPEIREPGSVIMGARAAGLLPLPRAAVIFLCGTVSHPALCSRGRLYLYLLRLLTKQTSLKRESRAQATGAPPPPFPRCTEMQNIVEMVS